MENLHSISLIESSFCEHREHKVIDISNRKITIEGNNEQEVINVIFNDGSDVIKQDGRIYAKRFEALLRYFTDKVAFGVAAE